MARTMVESCDLCGQYRKHSELVTVHALGEPVDVCQQCQAEPISHVLTAAQARGQETAAAKQPELA